MGSHKKFDSSSDEDDKRDKQKRKQEVKVCHKNRHSDSSDEDAPKKKYRASNEQKRYEKSNRFDDKEHRSDKKHLQDNKIASSSKYRSDHHRSGNESNRRDYHEHKRDDSKRDIRHSYKDKKLSQEEINKQRKMLWSKPKQEEKDISGPVETSLIPKPTDKNAVHWSSSIAAAGVGGQQANKFLKLMGIKSAPPLNNSVKQDELNKEHERQQKMLSDLDRQYQVARESTHMGKGMGFGFH